MKAICLILMIQQTRTFNGKKIVAISCTGKVIGKGNMSRQLKEIAQYRTEEFPDVKTCP